MRITPRNNRFYELFTDAASNIVTATTVLAQLLGSDAAERSQLADELSDIEHRGDSVTHQIMRELNTSFITPFDRQDIALMAGRLDDVVDDIQAAGDLCVLYRLGPVPADVLQQAALLQEAATITVEAMPRLKSLNKLEDYWISINEVENRADVVYRRLLGTIFDNPPDVLGAIKLKEVVDQLENAADAFESVANIVQGIAAKES